MALVESVFNHLVLPPKLPGQQDTDIEAIQDIILNRLINACDTIGKHTGHEFGETWRPTRDSLLTCLNMNAGRLEKASMVKEFSKLQRHGFLILHVVEQNAALIIRYHTSDGVDTVIFEAFEASPSAENVLASENALQWDFPGCAAEIPITEYFNASFQDSLATFLQDASMEALARFRARSTKANISVIEARDTTSPTLITQMLMPLLEAIGSSVDVPRLRKRVRDDVNIQNAEFPWRRLPFWLILRVATQRQLCLAHGNDTGRAYYKFLVCTVLAQLLADCTGKLTPELTMMLKAKLCRRLAKLEMDKTRTDSVVYEQLFSSVGPYFKEIIEQVARQIESAWANLKKAITRPIPELSSRADEQALKLSLPSSGKYLYNLLTLPTAPVMNSSSLQFPLLKEGANEQFKLFTDRYFNLAKLEDNLETERNFSLAELEDELETERMSTTGAVQGFQTRCFKLAQSIINLFTSVGHNYDSCPEQMSVFILNLFDLWVQMDKSAVKACPLLLDYPPVFHPELLDVLQLPTLSGMQRLRDIQRHLQSRCIGCRFHDKTIFSEPDRVCFAVQYLESSTQLQKLQQQIENASNRSYERKKAEWKIACENYNELSRKISDGTCVCSFNPDGSRNVRGCTRCWHWRCRKKMEITVHEDFLPKDISRTAAVVFELGIPSYLATYRNVTWRIISNLGYPSKPDNIQPPVMLLKDYTQLQPFGRSTVNGISLASSKKSFLQTHFKARKMKVEFPEVTSPLALQFAYYDMQEGKWLKNYDRPLTFQHLCGICVPRGLRASVMRPMEHPEADADGPSSYQTVANQTRCPSDMSAHEFMSFQRLLAGKTRRWPTMLVELGASNLNFSMEDTTQVFNQLSVQAGPAENDSDVLRDAHFFFRDQSFCQRLTEQIGKRLLNIKSNWRETNCMEMLITISLRLFSLSADSDRHRAETLLAGAREATSSWISRLRDEVRNAVEADAAQRAATYGFWAALLCRRTFAIFHESKSKINAEDLCTFVQASIALQENLVADLEKLPQSLKIMMVRDAKMAYQIQLLIKESIESNPQSLGIAINKTWSDSNNFTGRIYSSWHFLAPPNERWISSTVTSTASDLFVPQVVHYDFLEGHLLIAGKPLGRLPGNIKESEEVRELFGNQHLLTFPSPLDGMSHVMATHIKGHEIHFGLRGKTVVIRALTARGLLEYVPRSVFVDKDNFDMPLSLIEHCVHWLNFNSKCLEIRQQSAMWTTRPGDWNLDMSSRRVRRRQSYLIDPYSDLFKRVALIFRHFEDVHRLTVFQPAGAKGRLSVELRHLELSFYVNRSGLLQCRELNAEIDPNQDARTLYGLESKIVLRDVANIERRSIIVALGQLTYKRHGMHCVVIARPSNEYGRFEIDEVLGRLSCPPEPRLLYSKAQFHAFTSFVVPDPLTGRTGSEEALYTLSSGYCQPWTPLNEYAFSILEVIRKLSPSREFYPKDKRCLQTVIWDQNLTTNIQHESYEAVIQGLLVKSERLRPFMARDTEARNITIETPSHLRRRGEFRRLLYQRNGYASDGLATEKDLSYTPRDRQANLDQATNVYQIVRLLRKQPFSIHTKKNMAAILHEWKLIGGFHNSAEYAPVSLSDLIESNISERLGNFVNFCRHTDPQDQYRLVFRLGLLSFGTKPDMDAIQILAAFGCLDELKVLQPPCYPSFTGFKLHESPTPESFLGVLALDYPAFESDSKQSRKQQNVAREKYRVLCDAEGRRIANFFLEQWPKEPSTENLESTLIDAQVALNRIIPEFERLHRNVELSKYVVQVQEILDRYVGTKSTSVPQVWNVKPAGFRAPNSDFVVPSLFADLLVTCKPIPQGPSTLDPKLRPTNNLLRAMNTPKESNNGNRSTTLSREMIELDNILGSFARSSDIQRRQYGKDLRKSLDALENVSGQFELHQTPPSSNIVREGINKARIALGNQFNSIRNAVVMDDRFQWLQLGGLWPCITPMTLLEQLRSRSNYKIGDDVKRGLVLYGVLITNLQRLHRLKDAQLKANRHRMLEECRNTGHENWDPLEFPEWLLLEVDSDILIRPEQVEVVHAIISPTSGSNSVLQMNMGKGKTSCIMPMAAAILADRKQLLRLIVPKPLLLQTAQTMQTRLGGLVDREIRHVPFSRRTLTTTNMLEQYSDLHREILCCCGIVLTTPEHILSYKLSGLQRLADSKLREARDMVKFQSWLSTTCRDILDESDFTLAVKTQLIYPSGAQIAVDGHPHRWEAAQILLSLVEDYLPELQREFPQSIEVTKRLSGFPMVHFLQTDVEEALHSRIIDDVCSGRLSLLRLVDPTSPVDKGEIKRVLSEDHFDHKLTKRVSRLFVDKSSVYKNIILIRGLLQNRILLLCLKKRWNVQYGLHPERHPIAVPYEAKGVPSQQAEFGHPDVAILFTCLSFYYSGVNLPQFSEGLQHVLRSDDPAAEYDRWTANSDDMPEDLHHWNVINVDDHGQIETLWRYLRLNRNVLDHYMNIFVFPVHAKQFGVKLQNSGWDLPLFFSSQQGKGAKTTGFSGTNDNKSMLPLTIRQDDLPSLHQTNAEVLTYLLQSRNRKCYVASSQGKRLTEEGLLRKLFSINIRILIDAGAYILEMDNQSLAKTWLDIDPKTKAAVYFGSDNRAWVKYRGSKRDVPLLATPFVDNLDECLVYLDEAHTRGVDLRLPQIARGALTLALGQTKDHTVQAAMRLRQLGSTQSVAFIAGPEVYQSILSLCKKRHGEIIDSSHVIQWLLEQTCLANSQLQSLYFAQGTDFCRRMDAQWENHKFLADSNHREAFLHVIQQRDQQSLERLYTSTAETQPKSLADLSSTELKGFIEELSKQRQAAAQGNGNVLYHSALEEVEQEREVEFQVEEVRQVQKPTHHKALAFPGLHATISHFATSGYLNGGSGFEHAFEALARTSIGQKYKVGGTKSRLFVSTEFSRTIEFGRHGPNDNFLRPVEWILWSRAMETALIIIPEEAELVIPIIHAKRRSKVHLIAYAAPVTKTMLHFNRLSYYVLPSLPTGYAVPNWFSLELGIFAGRLYVDFREVDLLKRYLQLEDKAGTEEVTQRVDAFAENPTNFLREWLTLCRKGQDITHTPMGYICQGRPLHENHPFFVTRSVDQGNILINKKKSTTKADEDEEDEDGDSDREDEWDEGGPVEEEVAG